MADVVDLCGDIVDALQTIATAMLVSNNKS